MVKDLFDLDFSRMEIVVLSIIPACFDLIVFLYVFIYLPKNRNNFVFSIFVLLVGLWQMADGFTRLSNTAETANEWFRVSGLFALFVMPFGILLVQNYLKRYKLSDSALLISQFLPSTLCLILAITRLDSYNIVSSRHWYWVANPEPTLLTSVIYGWVCFQAVYMLSVLWLDYHFEKSDKVHAKQVLLLALAITIPFAGWIVAEAILPLFFDMDTIPVTSTLSIIFSLTAFMVMKKYQLLDYSPRHQWESVVETMSEGLLIVNNDDEIMYANKMFCELLGYKFEDIKGKVAHTLLFDELQEQEIIKSAIEDRKNKISGKYDIQLKDSRGRKIWFSISGSPYMDNNGKVIGSIGIHTDINTLKIAESRFRALIENAGDIITMTDKGGKVIYASPALEKITGFPIENVVGKLGFAIMQPELIEASRNLLEELMRKPGVPIPRTIRAVHKDGHHIWLEGTVVNLLEDKNIEAIVSNYRDITEKKKSQEKLEQNEKWFNTMVKYGNDAIAIMDANGNLEYLSPNNERILGYSTEELMINNKREGTYPEDKENLAFITKTIMESPGKTFRHEWRRWHKGGYWVWLEADATNLLNDPNIKGLLINYRDVTERKQAEEKLQRSEKIYKTIASSITGSAILIIDKDYRYELVEGDMIEQFGYFKEKLLGANARDILSPEVFKHIEKDFKRVFEGHYFTTESSLNGYDIITRYVPLHDEKHEVYAALIVGIDVSEVKQAQKDIAELNRVLEAKVLERTSQLETANKELESFSYSVSHDLRAPLRAIHGYTQIIQNEYGSQLDAEGNRLMNRVLVNTKKMGQLIDELLTFSRLGKKELAKHLFSMKDMVSSVVNELKGLETGRQIDVRIDKLPDAEADSSTIKQVWTNLISNAIKYSRHKEIAIIEIGFREEEHEMVYYIKDNGAGFDMRFVNKLFGVFQRLHSEEEFEGIGVGLAIVQRIILKHGGRVWAEGKMDEGATFYFTLLKTKTI